MTQEQMQELYTIIDLIHRTDDKSIQDKLKTIANIQLDVLLAEAKGK